MEIAAFLRYIPRFFEMYAQTEYPLNLLVIELIVGTLGATVMTLTATLFL